MASPARSVILRWVCPRPVLEFQKCLDSTPTVGFEVVKRIVEEDLGRPIDDLFASFDKEPLASASIAQVTLAPGGFCAG